MLLKAKPLRWFWGLIPLILISILVVYGVKDPIERDLSARSIAALKSAGIEGVTLKFDGRDGTLVGKTLSDEQRLKALEIVRGVFGVRVVRDQLSLSEAISPYIWSGALNDDGLLLSGYIPSSKMRETLRGLATAKFPSLKLKDKMTVAHGAGDEAQWLGQVSYALDKLARLQSGKVEMVDQTFNLDGVAKDVEAYKYLNDKFNQPLPAKIIKGAVALKSPPVKDYNFTAEWNEGQLTLAGYVLDEAMRRQILQQAKSLVGGSEVKSDINFGSGAPNGWGDALIVSLNALSKLNSGMIALKGDQVTVEGVASSEEIAKDVRVAVRSEYPIGYRVVDKIALAAPELDIASPYKLSIVKEVSDKIIIDGFVANTKMRNAILSKLGQAFSGAKITDNLSLARGAPNAMVGAIEIGISLLAPLKSGRFELIDDDLKISGITNDEQHVKDIDIRTAELPGNFFLENLVVYEKPPQPKKTEIKKEVTSEAELAAARNWLSPEETKERLDKLHIESGAVSAKECQLLMNSIVRGSAIRFAVDSSKIDQSSYDILAKVKSVATHCSNTVIRVEGHTDSDGSDVYNLNLSKQRAQSVISHLNKLGVSSRRLDAKGYGEKKPVASNLTDNGKALNRRIEFVVFEN